MAKTIVLQSTEVDDQEFFDNWIDHYIEKCKDVEGVEAVSYTHMKLPTTPYV